ncbi:MAG: aminotransferase class V-fold PLP-dependent enzyme [Bacteroidota bacterium]|jgi:selenocysteine lyase/cysteine desulfurase
MHKRTFLKSVLLAACSPFTSKAQSLTDELDRIARSSGNDYWENIRSDYDSNTDFINLENGYYSMMAKPVMEAYLRDIRYTNRESSRYMRTVQFENKFKTRDRLADLVGCNKDELIITRNTTESLDTIISGIDWKAGDEAVVAYQDYGSMLDMFRQQQRRYGIVVKYVSVPPHPKSDKDIVEVYEQAITPRTRLLMICHIINTTGHILPVKKICDMAHRKGVEVMVDGAHAIAHIDFRINDLNCDYYGSSLHKWLGAPLGAGLLYVRKDRIRKIWPLFGEGAYADDDIRKLNHTGTNPVAVDIAVNHAIDYHVAIGIKRKEERLRFLQQYWTKKVRKLKKVNIHTPLEDNRSCAIANFSIEGLSPAELSGALFNKYRIWTVAIDNPQAGVRGVRVTPHLYTTTATLDTLVNAVSELAK